MEVKNAMQGQPPIAMADCIQWLDAEITVLKASIEHEKVMLRHPDSKYFAESMMHHCAQQKALLSRYQSVLAWLVLSQTAASVVAAPKPRLDYDIITSAPGTTLFNFKDEP